jgi:carbamoyltransferase
MVVGWVQGRMEFGPRALCHRSILADPRSRSMLDRVNELKGREKWRPLAPVVPAERAGDYFELDGESPFMLFATKVRPLARKCAPAIVHVDGSARPQTVREAQDPRMYRLLHAFERRSGLPVLLNTSFNGPGQPIVCTPVEAVQTFLERGLDVLICGDFVATRLDAEDG